MAKKSHIPASIRTHVMAQYSCCVACGTWDANECGHIVAEANGGAMTKENFVRLCGSCNRVQGTRSVAFGAYAEYTESRALIESRRAYWSRYCGRAKIAKPYRPGG